MTFLISLIFAPFIWLVMLLASKYSLKKGINEFVGIRTSYSMRSKENWRYIHKFFYDVSKYNFICFTLISLIFYFSNLSNKNSNLILSVTLILSIVVFIVEYLYIKKKIENGK